MSTLHEPINSATDGCVLVKNGGSSYEGKQGHTLSGGISAETAGSTGLCLHSLDIPPGGRANPHVHENHESAIYLISGEADVWHGEGFQKFFVAHAGDFIYIPAGVPHIAINRSTTETIRAVVARTDPNEQESVRLMSLPDHID